MSGLLTLLAVLVSICQLVSSYAKSANHESNVFDRHDAAHAKTGPIGVEVGPGRPLAFVNHALSIRMWEPVKGPLSANDLEMLLQELYEEAVDKRMAGALDENGFPLLPHRPREPSWKPNKRSSRENGQDTFPIDESGWPKADATGVIFDERAVFAWKPPEDDPEKKQPDESGVYHLSLTGYAEVEGSSPVTVSNVHYDRETNTLHGEVNLPKGAPDLMVLTFRNTRRTPQSANGTGFTNLRITYPKYANQTDKLFIDELIKALEPFDHMRFMGWLGTNYNPWLCGGDDAVPCSVIEWADRPLPTDAMFGDRAIRAGANGHPWEWIVLLANAVNKDIWINIPVSASGAGFRGTRTPSQETLSYIYQLALLLRDGNEYTGHKGLSEHLNIYIEHSNEVWNFGFSQYGFNKAAAEDEVKKGGSELDNNKVPWVNGSNPEIWTHRRHAQRLYLIAKTFEVVFGKGSLNKRIRPIYAWWTIFPQQYNNTLSWAEATYGPVKEYFWGMAMTHYYSDNAAARQGATVSDVLNALRQSSDDGVNRTVQLAALKQHFNLKLCTYESGTGMHVGNTTNIGNRILANRDPKVKDIVVRDVRDNYWPHGGDSCNYFTLNGASSRYGCFWLFEDLFEPLDTPKMQGIWELTGYHPHT